MRNCPARWEVEKAALQIFPKKFLAETSEINGLCDGKNRKFLFKTLARMLRVGAFANDLPTT
jgi:hypothetical protein